LFSRVFPLRAIAGADERHSVLACVSVGNARLFTYEQ
jgi:hypothetical protein